jgi:hypothetical protein
MIGFGIETTVDERHAVKRVEVHVQRREIIIVVESMIIGVTDSEYRQRRVLQRETVRSHLEAASKLKNMSMSS